MSTADTPSSSDPVMDKAAVTGLVREELERNSKYFAFAQDQIEKDRSFFKHLYGITSAAILVILAAAGYFQYTSVNQMRADMKASVDAQMESAKAEIAAMRAQALQASAEAQYTVSRELANVRTEVQKRIDNEFKNENITALVSSAAKERTEKELAGIIRSETATQVAQGIKASGPTIQKAVEDETKEAVKALEPTIKASVDNATQVQIHKSVAPINAQMDAYGAFLRIGTLTTLARSDDRHAFDALLQIAIGNSPESKNAELLKIADSTVGAVIAEEERDMGIKWVRSFVKPQTPDSLKEIMKSPNQLDRQTALDHYGQGDRSVLPILVEMLKSEPSIRVLARASALFNSITKQSFQWWETKEALDWWAKNQKSFQ